MFDIGLEPVSHDLTVETHNGNGHILRSRIFGLSYCGPKLCKNVSRLDNLHLISDLRFGMETQVGPPQLRGQGGQSDFPTLKITRSHTNLDSLKG